MTPFWDGLLVLRDNWQFVLGILILMLLAQSFIHLVMRWIFEAGLTEEEYLSLGIGGWLLPASLLSLIWYGLRTAGLPASRALVLLSLPIVLGTLFFFRVRKQPLQASKPVLVGLTFLFCIFLILRLAFVSRTLMPPYFDSIRHYTIIKSLAGDMESASRTGSIQWLTTNYYHVGFHFLVAFVQSLLQANITKTMLIMGQMILAAIPFAAFFLVKHETASTRAGFFALLLAGVGWSMPAYAVNWGKYPALTSLSLIQFVLCLTYLTAKRWRLLTGEKKWGLGVVLVIGTGLSGFFHTRSLVVIGIVLISALSTRSWQKLPERTRAVLFGMLILGVVSEAIFMQRQEILAPLFDPYTGKWLVITLAVLFLSIFAAKIFPKMTFTSLLGMFLLLGSTFIPTLNIIPRFANQTLLDRTFVEMILYFPLSLVGGLGLAGCEQVLKDLSLARRSAHILSNGTLTVLVIGFVLGNALLRSDFYPLDCCNIVSQDDLDAMSWINENLPSEARILISGDEEIVQASGALQGYAPVDAGAWITPLTGRMTFTFPYGTNLSQQRKFNSLCRMGIDYIYIGAIGRSFYAPRLRAHPNWYRSLFSRNRTEVYEVIGCH